MNRARLAFVIGGLLLVSTSAYPATLYNTLLSYFLSRPAASSVLSGDTVMLMRGGATYQIPATTLTGVAGSGTVTSAGLSVPGSSIFGVTGSPVTISGTLGLTTTGTSGGIPYFSSGSALSSSAALTANLPLIGGGAGVAPSVGTRSGNTTAFVTTTGAQTSGDCVKIDASGNHIANGSACGGGGGSGTVTNPGNLTTHAPLIGGANGTTDAKAIAAMTNGQIPIGSTGADPVPAALTAGNGIAVTNGAGSITLKTTVADATDTNTTSYTVVAGNMGGAERLAAASGTPALILDVKSATLWQPGMSFSFIVGGTVPYTVTNSTGLTIKNLNSTTLPIGTSGTFVANANATDLDFYPGMQPPTATALGGVSSNACPGGQHATGAFTAAGVPSCSADSGGGFTSTLSSWSPTLSCNAGSLTTSSVQYAKYVTPNSGNLTFFTIKLTITTAGTCSYVKFTLPNTADASVGAVFAAKEVTATGVAGQTEIAASGTTAIISKYDAANSAVDGYVWVTSGWYSNQ